MLQRNKYEITMNSVPKFTPSRVIKWHRHTLTLICTNWAPYLAHAQSFFSSVNVKEKMVIHYSITVAPTLLFSQTSRSQVKPHPAKATQPICKVLLRCQTFSLNCILFTKPPKPPCWLSVSTTKAASTKTATRMTRAILFILNLCNLNSMLLCGGKSLLLSVSKRSSCFPEWTN